MYVSNQFSDGSSMFETILAETFGSRSGQVLATLAELSRDDNVLLMLPPNPEDERRGGKAGPARVISGMRQSEEPGSETDDLDPFSHVSLCITDYPDGLLDEVRDGRFTALVGTVPMGRPSDHLKYANGRVRDLAGYTLGGLVDRMEPGAQLVVAVHSGFFASRRSEETRRALMESGHVSHLVEVGHEKHRKGHVHPALRLSVLRYVHGMDQGQPSALFRLPTSSTSRVQDALDEIRGSRGATREGFSHGYVTELSPDRLWQYERLHPDRQALLARLQSQSNVVKLGDIAELVSGRARPIRQEEGPSDSQVHMLKARDLRGDLPEISELDHATATGGETPVKQGDMVGAVIGQQQHWTVIGDEYEREGVCAAVHTVVVRLHDNYQVFLPFVRGYLDSEFAATQLAPSEGTMLPRIRVGDLADMLVPLPGPSADVFAARWDQLDRGFGLLDWLHAQLSELRDSVFEEVDPGRIGGRLAEASDQARLIADVVEQQQEPLRRVRDLYPYPVSRVVRSYQHALRPEDEYKQILRIGENLIVTLGVMGLAWAREHDRFPSQFRHLARGWQRGGGSLGHWLGMARECARNMREDGVEFSGYADALETGRKKGLLSALESLLSARNDEAHGAGPRTDLEVQATLTELEPELNIALEESSFLARTTWLLPKRASWRRTTRRFEITALKLMGDHPEFEPAVIYEDNPVAENAIYVTPDTEGRPYDLTPFCVMLPCNKCLRSEIYYPDRVDNNGAHLRSLDRGHQLADGDLGDELEVIMERHQPSD